MYKYFMYQIYPIITAKIPDLVLNHTKHLNLNSKRFKVLIVGNISIDALSDDFLGLAAILLTPLLILGLNGFGFLFLGKIGQLTPYPLRDNLHKRRSSREHPNEALRTSCQ